MFNFILVCIFYRWTILRISATNPELTFNSTFVTTNEVLQLTCRHSSEKIVDWWIQSKGTSSFRNILTTGFVGTVCSKVPLLLPVEILSCECTEATTFKCTLKPITPANYDDKWKCAILDNTQPSFSNEMTILERVSVEYVTLTPALPHIYVLPNVAISYMRCVSSVGRPPPIITWYLDNKTPDYIDDFDLTGRSNSSTVAYVTTSILTMTPTNIDQDARIYCNVSNGYRTIMSDRTLKINVLSYPTKPIIQYNMVVVPSSISIIQNSTMTLQCFSSGDPAPSISWTLFNGSLINSSVITLNIATNNNQEQIVCRATSHMDPTNGFRITVENTTALTVNILYPPSSPSCQIGPFTIQSNIIRAVVNEPFTMTCTSRSNPPPSRYTWTLPYGVKQNGTQLYIQRMQPSDNYRYTLELVNEINATYVRDVVYGNITGSYTFKILYPVTNLSVYHRGQTDQHITSPTINIIKGREVSFGCNTYSNPPASYSWTLSGVIVANGANWSTNFVDDTIIGCIATQNLDPTGTEARTTSSSSNVSINLLCE